MPGSVGASSAAGVRGSRAVSNMRTDRGGDLCRRVRRRVRSSVRRGARPRCSIRLYRQTLAWHCAVGTDGFGSTRHGHGSCQRRGRFGGRRQLLNVPSGIGLRRRSWRQNRVARFAVQVRNLTLNLRLKLVGSALEVVQQFANLTGNFRKLLGPEDNQGKKKQKYGFRKTHGCIIYG